MQCSTSFQASNLVRSFVPSNGSSSRCLTRGRVLISRSNLRNSWTNVKKQPRKVKAVSHSLTVLTTCALQPCDKRRELLLLLTCDDQQIREYNAITQERNLMQHYECKCIDACNLKFKKQFNSPIKFHKLLVIGESDQGLIISYQMATFFAVLKPTA